MLYHVPITYIFYLLLLWLPPLKFSVSSINQKDVQEMRASQRSSAIFYREKLQDLIKYVPYIHSAYRHSETILFQNVIFSWKQSKILLQSGLYSITLLQCLRHAYMWKTFENCLDLILVFNSCEELKTNRVIWNLVTSIQIFTNYVRITFVIQKILQIIRVTMKFHFLSLNLTQCALHTSINYYTLFQ